jgi:hypothetical protein
MPEARARQSIDALLDAVGCDVRNLTQGRSLLKATTTSLSSEKLKLTSTLSFSVHSRSRWRRY